MRTRFGAALIGLLAVSAGSPPARAADHLDGAAVKTDKATDINDVYAWTSADGSKVTLVMTVFPAADAGAAFSTSAWYVFHTASRASFAATQATPVDITCGFKADKKIECWIGGDRSQYFSGDASNAAGISRLGGKVKAFAGLRKDHFFFNLDGFNTVRSAVKAAAGGLTFDGAGCPTLDITTANTLVTQLKKAPAGTDAVDFFKDLNTLAIVLELDKSLLNKGGNFFSVWAGTHRK